MQEYACPLFVYGLQLLVFLSANNIFEAFLDQKLIVVNIPMQRGTLQFDHHTTVLVGIQCVDSLMHISNPNLFDQQLVWVWYPNLQSLIQSTLRRPLSGWLFLRFVEIPGREICNAVMCRYKYNFCRWVDGPCGLLWYSFCLYIIVPFTYL